ncbi:MAG TPA: hypothetical protein VLE20_12550 [Blastocatellia bacterium]|nr:hypothetical protein [Blastocatellia bacterium]
MNAGVKEGYIEDREKEPTVTGGVVERVMKAGAQMSELSHQAGRLKSVASSAVSEAIEDGKAAARRAVKRSYNRAEDLMDDAAHRVKKSPLQAVAVGFGVGLLFGAIFTRLIRK